MTSARCPSSRAAAALLAALRARRRARDRRAHRGATATVGPAQVKQLVDDLEQGGTIRRDADVTRAQAGRPADDPADRLRPPLRRRRRRDARSDTMMLVRLDPDANAIDGDVDPARPQGRDPRRGARRREDQRRLHRRRPRLLTAKVLKQLLPACRSTTSSTSTSAASGARSTRSAASTPTSTAATTTHTSAAARAVPEIDVQPGYQRLCGQRRARLRALPPHRHRHRARRPPAGLPAPGEGAVRRRPASSPTRDKLHEVFGKHTQTDSSTAAQRRAAAACSTSSRFSASHPIREVHFPRYELLPPASYVDASAGRSSTRAPSTSS